MTPPDPNRVIINNNAYYLRLRNPTPHTGAFNIFPVITSVPGILSGEMPISFFRLQAPNADGNETTNLTFYFNTNQDRVVGLAFPSSVWGQTLGDEKLDIIQAHEDGDRIVSAFDIDHLTTHLWRQVEADEDDDAFYPQDFVLNPNVEATARLHSVTPQNFLDFYTSLT